MYNNKLCNPTTYSRHTILNIIKEVLLYNGDVVQLHLSEEQKTAITIAINRGYIDIFFDLMYKLFACMEANSFFSLLDELLIHTIHYNIIKYFNDESKLVQNLTTKRHDLFLKTILGYMHLLRSHNNQSSYLSNKKYFMATFLNTIKTYFTANKNFTRFAALFNKHYKVEKIDIFVEPFNENSIRESLPNNNKAYYTKNGDEWSFTCYSYARKRILTNKETIAENIKILNSLIGNSEKILNMDATKAPLRKLVDNSLELLHFTKVGCLLAKSFEIILLNGGILYFDENVFSLSSRIKNDLNTIKEIHKPLVDTLRKQTTHIEIRDITLTKPAILSSTILPTEKKTQILVKFNLLALDINSNIKHVIIKQSNTDNKSVEEKLVDIKNFLLAHSRFITLLLINQIETVLAGLLREAETDDYLYPLLQKNYNQLKIHSLYYLCLKFFAQPKEDIKKSIDPKKLDEHALIFLWLSFLLKGHNKFSTHYKPKFTSIIFQSELFGIASNFALLLSNLEETDNYLKPSDESLTELCQIISLSPSKRDFTKNLHERFIAYMSQKNNLIYLNTQIKYNTILSLWVKQYYQFLPYKAKSFIRNNSILKTFTLRSTDSVKNAKKTLRCYSKTVENHFIIDQEISKQQYLSGLRAFLNPMDKLNISKKLTKLISSHIQEESTSKIPSLYTLTLTFIITSPTLEKVNTTFNMNNFNKERFIHFLRELNWKHSTLQTFIRQNIGYLPENTKKFFENNYTFFNSKYLNSIQNKEKSSETEEKEPDFSSWKNRKRK